MQLAEGIRRHGFRKWYERELILSHVHLVLAFLCAIGLFATFAVYSQQAPLAVQLFDAFAVLLCAGIGAWALRRYLDLRLHAETVANQAVCPQCRTCARFELLEEDRARQQLRVSCRACRHAWPIRE